MDHTTNTKYIDHNPPPKKDEQEFGLAPGGITVCPECGSAFFDKRWHHTVDQAGDLEPGTAVNSHICPACSMSRDKTYEGEIRIKLSPEHAEKKEEIFNLIENSHQQARQHDPMHRILWQENKDGMWHVYTSENQLAVRIGKKLESAFKGSSLEIHHSNDEDVSRVYWSY